MQLRLPRPALLAAVAFALPTLAGFATADILHLVDGTTMTGVEVVNELATGISYKQEGKSGEQMIDADRVLLIEYKKLPKQIDTAESMVADGAIFDGVDELQAFVDGVLSGENRKDRQKWAPAHALQRIVSLRMSLGDTQGVIDAVDLLVKNAPDSRHVPAALIAKSLAQRAREKATAADATLEELRALIADKGLSKRWSLELELAEIDADARLVGQAKRDRLIEVAGQARSNYPTVRNRARVAEGETFLEGSTKDFDSARAIFEEIVADPKADDDTLAGAYTGLGDCLFHVATQKQGKGEEAAEDLRLALMAYMRVVVNYKDQTRYVAKALFYAGRVFDFLADDASKANARKLYATLVQTYPDSEWAGMARKVR